MSESINEKLSKSSKKLKKKRLAQRLEFFALTLDKNLLFNYCNFLASLSIKADTFSNVDLLNYTYQSKFFSALYN